MTALVTTGWVISGLGLLIELLAAIGMACYPVRKRIRAMNPLQLQSLGCCVFYVGVAFIIAGHWGR